MDKPSIDIQLLNLVQHFVYHIYNDELHNCGLDISTMKMLIGGMPALDYHIKQQCISILSHVERSVMTQTSEDYYHHILNTLSVVSMILEARKQYRSSTCSPTRCQKPAGNPLRLIDIHSLEHALWSL